MNAAALLTVPRYAPAQHLITRTRAQSALERITPAVRQRAARRLADAVARGMLSPARLQRALEQGDRGLAEAMREHEALPMLPASTRQDFCQLAPRPLPPQVRQQVITWLERAVAMGMVRPEDLVALERRGFDASAVRELLVASFNSFAQTVADGVPRCGWHDPHSACPILVQPAVLALLDGDDMPGQGDASVDPALSLHLMVQDAPVYAMPTRLGDDEAFYRAYTTAWDDLAKAGPAGLLLRCADTWPAIMGFFDEQLGDLALQAECKNGQWHFSEACCDIAENELGFNLRDEDMREAMATHLAFRQRRAALKPLGAKTAQFKAWSRRASGPQRALVAYLRELTDFLLARRSSPRHDWQYACDGPPVALGLINTGHGLDDFVNDTLNSYGCEEAICELVQPRAADQLPNLVNGLLLEVAIAHAAINAIYDYQAKYAPRPTHR